MHMTDLKPGDVVYRCVPISTMKSPRSHGGDGAVPKKVQWYVTTVTVSEVEGRLVFYEDSLHSRVNIPPLPIREIGGCSRTPDGAVALAIARQISYLQNRVQEHQNNITSIARLLSLPSGVPVVTAEEITA